MSREAFPVSPLSGKNTVFPSQVELNGSCKIRLSGKARGYSGPASSWPCVPGPVEAAVLCLFLEQRLPFPACCPEREGGLARRVLCVCLTEGSERLPGVIPGRFLSR